MKPGNRWNRFIYRLWSPIYDSLVEEVLHPGRLRSMELADTQPGERVCLIGVGTGNDLPLLPAGVAALGIDLSEAMLRQARKKLPIPGCDIQLIVGDAQALPAKVADTSFDVVILNLILCIVPDPARAMSEAVRVLRPGGRMVVYDKFLPEDVQPSLLRRMANAVTTLLGSRINRRLGDIIAGQPLRIEQEEPSILGGMYRVVMLRKSA